MNKFKIALNWIRENPEEKDRILADVVIVIAFFVMAFMAFCASQSV